MSARRVAAVGIFAALAYSGSFVLLAVPNVTLSILLVFYAGYHLERFDGALVGLISALLISIFNPYGLAPLPVLGAQVVGYILVGACGSVAVRILPEPTGWFWYLMLGIFGVLTALIYMLPVSLADAFLFGPFWERFWLSALFSLVTVASNVVFFVILFPALAKVKKSGMFRFN